MDVFPHWAEETRSTALARVGKDSVHEANARFRELDAGKEAWRWLAGPHARVRYGSLSELVRSESATLAPAPYLARFERGAQVFEVRLERLEAGAMAVVHDVTADLRRQREMQRGVAHDLNHVLNIIALRVATLRADPALGKVRRTLDVLGRVVGDAALIVGRLQDLARKRRDRPSDALDLAAVLTGAIEMEPLRATPQRSGTRRRVLIVDDEQDNLEVLREFLEMDGQDVTIARSGPEALARVAEGESFDLVLCDVSMPEMSGWQVARELQSSAPGTAVWMLTGMANEISESDPRRTLVRGVLGKPLDLERLHTLLSSVDPRHDEGAPAMH